MAAISFALLEAHQRGASFARLAEVLDLPLEFVEERVEAARLSLLFRHPRT